MRKILVPLSGRYELDVPDRLDVAALKAAFHVARHLESHVEVLCVIDRAPELTEPWPFWLPGAAATEFIEWIERQSELSRLEMRKTYDRLLADMEHAPAQVTEACDGYSVNFVERPGPLSETVGAAGRLSDLIVIASAEDRWHSASRPIADASLRRTGCPVLVVPEAPLRTFAKRIMIAWNDTPESARALRAALRLLAEADEVHIVTCRESDEVDPSAADLAAYLSCHGIKASTHRIEHPGREAPSAIVQLSQDAGCDLIVMGAHIQWRAYAFLFGSMTEYVMNDPRLPVMLVA